MEVAANDGFEPITPECRTAFEWRVLKLLAEQRNDLIGFGSSPRIFGQSSTQMTPRIAGALAGTFQRTVRERFFDQAQMPDQDAGTGFGLFHSKAVEGKLRTACRIVCERCCRL